MAGGPAGARAGTGKVSAGTRGNPCRLAPVPAGKNPREPRDQQFGQDHGLGHAVLLAGKNRLQLAFGQRFRAPGQAKVAHRVRQVFFTCRRPAPAASPLSRSRQICRAKRVMSARLSDGAGG